MRMRRAELMEDVFSTPAPAGWADALNRGIADVEQGHVIPFSDIINDLDAVLADMANGADNTSTSEPMEQGTQSRDPFPGNSAKRVRSTNARNRS